MSRTFSTKKGLLESLKWLGGGVGHPVCPLTNPHELWLHVPERVSTRIRAVIMHALTLFRDCFSDASLWCPKDKSLISNDLRKILKSLTLINSSRSMRRTGHCPLIREESDRIVPFYIVDRHNRKCQNL